MEGSWAAGNILFLQLTAGYMVGIHFVQFYQTTLKICALFCCVSLCYGLNQNAYIMHILIDPVILNFQKTILWKFIKYACKDLAVRCQF